MAPKIAIVFVCSPRISVAIPHARYAELRIGEKLVADEPAHLVLHVWPYPQARRGRESRH